jgi:hypothetical protein
MQERDGFTRPTPLAIETAWDVVRALQTEHLLSVELGPFFSAGDEDCSVWLQWSGQHCNLFCVIEGDGTIMIDALSPQSSTPATSPEHAAQLLAERLSGSG